MYSSGGLAPLVHAFVVARVLEFPPPVRAFGFLGELRLRLGVVVEFASASSWPRVSWLKSLALPRVVCGMPAILMRRAHEAGAAAGFVGEFVDRCAEVEESLVSVGFLDGGQVGALRVLDEHDLAFLPVGEVADGAGVMLGRL